MRNSNSNTILFQDGAIQFRLRVICSLISCRPIKIMNIRHRDDEEPGLRDYEISFLRLIDRITNGTVIKINPTGTELFFKPGILTMDDETIVHECPLSRNIGYFIEGILPLGPFGKNHMHIQFHGITDGTHSDPTPTYISTVLPLIMSYFNIGTDADEVPSSPYVKVHKVGFAPQGQGVVEIFCPLIRKELSSIDLTDVGKVKRIRGLCTSCKISPSSSMRVAHTAKGLLHRLLPDVWITTNAHSTKSGCGPSPGLSLCLTAETTTGIKLCTETYMCNDNESGKKDLPEDLGVRGASMLLNEIKNTNGGCIGNNGFVQSITSLWMLLCTEGDVSRIRIGTIHPFTIAALRLYKQFFNIEFKIKISNSASDNGNDKSILLSCLGIGYRNMAKAST